MGQVKGTEKSFEGYYYKYKTMEDKKQVIDIWKSMGYELRHNTSILDNNRYEYICISEGKIMGTSSSVNKTEYKLEVKTKEDEYKIGDFVEIIHSGEEYANAKDKAEEMGAYNYLPNKFNNGDIVKISAINKGRLTEGRSLYLLTNYIGKQSLYNSKGFKRYNSSEVKTEEVKINTSTSFNIGDIVGYDIHRQAIKDAAEKFAEQTEQNLFNNNKPMNKLQEAMVDKFVTTKGNVEAMNNVNEESARLIEVLEAIESRINKVKERTKRFKYTFNDSISESNVKLIDKQIKDFKEIEEYLTVFLNNKLRDLVDIKENKFDVAEFFKS